MLGEDGDSCLLWDLADEMRSERIAASGSMVPTTAPIAFTLAGMEYLRELLAEHKRNRSSPRS